MNRTSLSQEILNNIPTLPYQVMHQNYFLFSIFFYAWSVLWWWHDGNEGENQTTFNICPLTCFILHIPHVTFFLYQTWTQIEHITHKNVLIQQTASSLYFTTFFIIFGRKREYFGGNIDPSVPHKQHTLLNIQIFTISPSYPVEEPVNLLDMIKLYRSCSCDKKIYSCIYISCSTTMPHTYFS